MYFEEKNYMNEFFFGCEFRLFIIYLWKMGALNLGFASFLWHFQGEIGCDFTSHV